MQLLLAGALGGPVAKCSSKSDFVANSQFGEVSLPGSHPSDLRRVRCHLLVEKNFRGNLPFDRNFIVICLSAEVRGRLPFGTNFVVVCFLFRARGNVLLKNGLHGQLPVNFKSAPGLPSARRASSVGVYRRKGTHLYRFPSLVNGKTRAVPIEGVLAAANRTTTRNKKLEGTHRL